MLNSSLARMLQVLLVLSIHASAGTFTFTELGRISGHNGTFNQPQAVSVSPDGIVYVVDSGNNRIQCFDLRGTFLRTIGGFGFKEDQFDNPSDIWTKSLINVYVADYNNRRVQRYDRGLNFISSLESDAANESEFQFEEIASCAVNSNNDLFLLDRSENKIVKINRHGLAERSFGSYESGEGELQEPQQLEIQDNKFVLVCDAGAKAIFVFDFFGTFIRKISNPLFKKPTGFCLFDNGKVLMADSEATKLFLFNNTFSEMEAIHLKTIRPLTRLTDVAAWQTEKQSLLYLIDGNEVIIGHLR